MRLRRIEVRDFRKLRHTIVDEIGDGLNVVVGDNEAGKSTLLAALRAALFERHNVTGAAADDMLPHGESVRPEVALDFEINGALWRLRKHFVQKPEAELAGPSERLVGQAVEEHLASLLGFTPPGRGRSKPTEHQGIFALLWVEQGRAHGPIEVGAGRDAVASALEAEVGDVLGGERGRTLLAAAEARRDALWTRVRAAPTGDYRQALAKVEDAEERLSTLRAEFRAYEEKIDALARTKASLAMHKHERTLEMRLAALAAAQAKADAIDTLRLGLADTVLKRQRFEAERKAAADTVSRREGLIEEERAASARVAPTAEEESHARRQLDEAKAAGRQAEKRLEEARAAAMAAEALVDAREREEARRRRFDELALLKERLAAAETTERARLEALSEAENQTVSDERLAALERLHDEAVRTRAGLEAASVRLAFRPERGGRVLIDGREHNAATPLVLARTTEVTLAGFGQVDVDPGGGAADLSAEAEAAGQHLADALRKAGCENIAGMRLRRQRGIEAKREAKAQATLLAAHAPEGLGALREAVGQIETELACAREPAAAGSSTPLSLEAAREQRRGARAAAQAAQTTLDRTREVLREASAQEARLSEQARGNRRDAEIRAGALEAARRDRSDEALRSALAFWEVELRVVSAVEAEAAQALDAANPDAARLDLQRVRAAVEHITNDIAAQEREEARLEAELTALGKNGLGEDVAEAEGALETARRQLRAKELEARASRLLYDTLVEARSQAKERWLEPIRTHVKPYLKLLQPGSEIVLDENSLEVAALKRDGFEEPFSSLSLGAREQVAVITRLALADVLRKAGHPSAIVLDDALVNTDSTRLERMRLILQAAARDLQILILTCREQDFLSLGAPIKRI